MEAGGVEPVDLLIISICYKGFGKKMAKSKKENLRKLNMKMIDKLSRGNLHRAVDLIILADLGYMYNPATRDFELPSRPSGERVQVGA